MIGDVIKGLRKKAGLSQGALAKELCVHQTAVSQWEMGKTTPDLQTLQLIANYFSVSVDMILGNDESIQVGATRPEAVDDDLWELREQLRRSPEMRTLFSLTRKAKPENLRKAVKILEALKGDGDEW